MQNICIEKPAQLKMSIPSSPAVFLQLLFTIYTQYFHLLTASVLYVIVIFMVNIRILGISHDRIVK